MTTLAEMLRRFEEHMKEHDIVPTEEVAKTYVKALGDLWDSQSAEEKASDD